MGNSFLGIILTITHQLVEFWAKFHLPSQNIGINFFCILRLLANWAPPISSTMQVLKLHGVNYVKALGKYDPMSFILTTQTRLILILYYSNV